LFFAYFFGPLNSPIRALLIYGALVDYTNLYINPARPTFFLYVGFIA